MYNLNQECFTVLKCVCCCRRVVQRGLHDVPLEPGRDQHLHGAGPQEAAGTQLPQEGGHQVSRLIIHKKKNLHFLLTGSLFLDCVIKVLKLIIFVQRFLKY